MGTLDSDMPTLARLREYRSLKISSWDRTGGNRDFVVLPKGERRTITEISGPGCIKHIWCTHGHGNDRDCMRSTILRMWWDGEATPSVEVPLADFFGGGFGVCKDFWSLPLQMNPDSGRGMNCWFPMPFRQHARIEVHNEWDKKGGLYYYVDYEVYPQAGARERARASRTAGTETGRYGPRGRVASGPRAGRGPLPDNGDGPWDENLAYFHAQWRRENPTQGWGRKDLKGPPNIENLRWYWKTPNTTGAENYIILEAKGQGQYVGCHLDIDCFRREKNDWYGEGDDMIFIDGEPWPPSLHGTGTEDYFSTAFCPRTEYSSPYCGLTQYSGGTWGAEERNWPFRGKNSVYRFHIEDPVRFRKSIRVTIEHGHNNKLSNDYSSTAYWYQIEPHARFPKLLPVKLRLARPDWPAFEPEPGTPAGPPKTATKGRRRR